MTTRLALDDIRIETRRREHLGDIDALAASLDRYGLIQPIVVDAEHRLIAGGRRLLAARFLGWTEIDVRAYGDLSEAERREIELEENLRRKDLTPYERSKTMVERATVAAEALRGEAEFSSHSDENSREGRPSKPDARDKVASRIGIPGTTLTKAEQHVAAAEAYPFMQGPGWKQYHVLEAREKLAALPDEARPGLVAILAEPGIPPRSAITMIDRISGLPNEQRVDILSRYATGDREFQALVKTKLVGLPPPADPCVIALNQVLDAFARAEGELKRCQRIGPPDLVTSILADLRTLSERVRAAQAEARRLHDALVETEAQW